MQPMRAGLGTTVSRSEQRYVFPRKSVLHKTSFFREYPENSRTFRKNKDYFSAMPRFFALFSKNEAIFSAKIRFYPIFVLGNNRRIFLRQARSFPHRSREGFFVPFFRKMQPVGPINSVFPLANRHRFPKYNPFSPSTRKTCPANRARTKRNRPHRRLFYHRNGTDRRPSFFTPSA